MPIFPIKKRNKAAPRKYVPFGIAIFRGAALFLKMVIIFERIKERGNHTSAAFLIRLSFLPFYPQISGVCCTRNDDIY